MYLISIHVPMLNSQTVTMQIWVWPRPLGRMSTGRSLSFPLTPIMSAAAFTDTKKEVVVPSASSGPLFSTETSPYLFPQSSLCLFLSVFECMAFWHCPLEYPSFHFRPVSILSSANTAVCYVFIIEVKNQSYRWCLHIPYDSKHFIFNYPSHFYFGTKAFLMLYKVLWPVCVETCFTTSACHVGWNPKIWDMSPTWDTEDITFLLIKLFSWPSLWTCGINKPR